MVLKNLLTLCGTQLAVFIGIGLNKSVQFCLLSLNCILCGSLIGLNLLRILIGIFKSHAAVNTSKDV